MNDVVVRTHLVRLLTWADAHASFERAVRHLDPVLRGEQPPRAPYSPWQLVEHMRITQADILNFCINPNYQELSWPYDYWPATREPPTDDAWNESIAGFLKDRAELVRIAEDRSVDLLAAIPHGDGQTYLRELLLVADHNSYHVGELVLVRRLLGAWPPA